MKYALTSSLVLILTLSACSASEPSPTVITKKKTAKSSGDAASGNGSQDSDSDDQADKPEVINGDEDQDPRPVDNPDDPVVTPPVDPVQPMPEPMPEPEPMPQVPNAEVTKYLEDAKARFDKAVKNIGPNYTDNAKTENGIAKGTVRTFTLQGSDSKAYPGNYRRAGHIYLPADFKEGEELPFIFVGDINWNQHNGDGGGENKGTITKVMDRLIAGKLIPRMAMVGLDPGPQRSVEYDTVSDRFVKFVEEEVLPKMEKDYKVKFTKDREGRAAMGGSSSGAMAFTMAWMRPELYSKVITYSGTFVTLQRPGAGDYSSKLVPESEKKAIRVTIHSSDNDLGGWRDANEKMSKALEAKGYDYRYLRSSSTSHIDIKVYRETFADNMVWLWRDYVPKAASK